MSTARVLLRQGNSNYRFLRFETSSDGSLLAFLDRSPRSNRHSMTTNESGVFIPDKFESDRPLPSGRFSIHTSGEIHRYAGGVRRSTIHIEPLYALTKLAAVGFFSIPRVTLLELLDENRDRHEVAATLEIPEHVTQRLTFVIEIGPQPQQPETYGVALNYELYSAVVRMVSTSLNLPPEMTDHFVHGMPTIGQFNSQQIDKVSAELEFYQRIHGRSAFVFREDKGGAYVAMAIVPMAKTPKLKITFDRDDLDVEIISFEYTQPNHKVRFWIRDKGGRNKKDDLRRHITSVELNAEL